MEDQKISIALVLGVALLVVLGSTLDGGLRIVVQVVGVLLVLLGIAVIGARTRRKPPPGGKDGMWLPSRDEDER